MSSQIWAPEHELPNMSSRTWAVPQLPTRKSQGYPFDVRKICLAAAAFTICSFVQHFEQIIVCSVKHICSANLLDKRTKIQNNERWFAQQIFLCRANGHLLSKICYFIEQFVEQICWAKRFLLDKSFSFVQDFRQNLSSKMSFAEQNFVICRANLFEQIC